MKFFTSVWTSSHIWLHFFSSPELRLFLTLLFFFFSFFFEVFHFGWCTNSLINSYVLWPLCEHYKSFIAIWNQRTLHLLVPIVLTSNYSTLDQRVNRGKTFVMFVLLQVKKLFSSLSHSLLLLDVLCLTSLRVVLCCVFFLE
jgi:hypothetical protein